MEEHYSLGELQKLAQDRLSPSITNPNYLVLRRRAQLISDWMEQIPGEGLRVLDIGGRYQPYRPLMNGRARQYVAIDVVRTLLVDVVGRGEQLPFGPDTFDVVIATQVFEYFPEPRVAALQIHRVLKPGGFLIMSVAAVCPRAVEQEHWRFLPAGLKFVLSDFSWLKIVPEVSSVGGSFRLANWSVSILARYILLGKVLYYTVVPAMNVIGLGLEHAFPIKNDELTGNYSILARK
ncbi:MAG: class I SAM-dependent methyltransferase [Terriglobales bacterium]